MLPRVLFWPRGEGWPGSCPALWLLRVSSVARAGSARFADGLANACDERRRIDGGCGSASLQAAARPMIPVLRVPLQFPERGCRGEGEWALANARVATWQSRIARRKGKKKTRAARAGICMMRSAPSRMIWSNCCSAPGGGSGPCHSAERMGVLTYCVCFVESSWPLWCFADARAITSRMVLPTRRASSRMRPKSEPVMRCSRAGSNMLTLEPRPSRSAAANLACLFMTIFFSLKFLEL